jgi:hypothetical protein
MPPELRSELEKLEERNRVLKERHNYLQAQCDALQAQIAKVRDRVTASAEGQEDASSSFESEGAKEK